MQVLGDPLCVGACRTVFRLDQADDGPVRFWLKRAVLNKNMQSLFGIDSKQGNTAIRIICLVLFNVRGTKYTAIRIACFFKADRKQGGNGGSNDSSWSYPGYQGDFPQCQVGSDSRNKNGYWPRNAHNGDQIANDKTMAPDLVKLESEATFKQDDCNS